MQYKKGQSGNPAGRPLGAKDKRTELRKLLDPHAESLVEKAVSMALEGDSTAMRLVIERIVPAFKAEGVLVDLPALRNAKSATEQADAALEAIASGAITIADGGALLGAISQQIKIREFEELEQRITALEGRNGQ